MITQKSFLNKSVRLKERRKLPAEQKLGFVLMHFCGQLCAYHHKQDIYNENFKMGIDPLRILQVC